MPFKLHAPYQPQGDQPQAIAELVAGLNAGERHQTLLGVTGSGKSLAWDEPVLVRTWRAGEAPTVRLQPIGPLVDAAMDSAASFPADEHGTQFIESSGDTEVLSFNPRTGVSEWRPVSGLSRHSAPKMYRVTTDCGRQVVVTGDHNFFSLRDGRLRLSETRGLSDQDFLPLPSGFSPPSQDMVTLDLLDLFQSDRTISADARVVLSWMIEQVGWPRVSEAMASHYPRPYAKRYRALRGVRNDRAIPLPVLLDIASRLGLTIPTDLPLEIRAWHSPRRVGGLPRLLPVNDELLTFLGLMLSEGHCADRYATFASYEGSVRAVFFRCAEALGISLHIRESSDLHFSSGLWNALLVRLVGARSREKHLPEFWPQLSARQLGVLLSAYFEGDGGMDGPVVSATTASRQLASELGYALFGFGLWARLHRRHKRATNSNHAGDWYHTVTLSGQTNLRGFAARIGFLTRRKNEALEHSIGRPENTNVDIVPVSGLEFTKLRTQAGLTKGRLARQADLSRQALILWEKGARRPSRSNLERLLGCIEEIGAKTEETQALIAEARTFLNARWTPVRSVESVDYEHPFVYDLTVEDNETFLAGHGGLFVHNTFAMANVIAQWGRPTLVLSHNKTLAAQLYGEFRQYFPENAVGYFISYYDYYQPEAYVPQTNTYIAKDASINDDIDRLRLQATSMLLEREDVIIVASVSCIYGLGTPEDWKGMRINVASGERVTRKQLLEQLVAIQYTRNDIEVGRGNFRVRGDVVEVHPAYEDTILRIELDDDLVSRISEVDGVTGTVKRRMEKLALYPAKHFVTPERRMNAALTGIRAELKEQLAKFRAEGKLLEAQRLQQRTEYDLEMLSAMGTCPGVENYSRHLSGRAPGERPGCLIDYFPTKPDGSPDFLLVIDESHVTVSQVGAMYEGDRSRKQVLVNFGFRLPSALDNRPLKFDEFERLTGPTIFVSATPSEFELQKTRGVIVEQIIRPTGLVDPEIEIRPITGQVDDLLAEIRKRVALKERVLVTTLTKRMAEDLTDYLSEMGVKIRYLHSDIDALERVEILRGLRLAEFDVLVGINLLREGLDLPEVSLVAILDADKEGFLRSERSLIQTAGRAARNLNGRVILYADVVTESMRRALDESGRRRAKQLAWNEAQGIVPRTVTKTVEEVMRATSIADNIGAGEEEEARRLVSALDGQDPRELIAQLETEMMAAARSLEFERAASLRDRIEEVEQALAISRGETVSAGKSGGRRGGREPRRRSHRFGGE